MMTATIFGLEAAPVHLSLESSSNITWAAFCRAFAWTEDLSAQLDGTSVRLRDHRGAGLAAACAMLAAEDIISATALDGWMLWADIAAYGELRPVSGVVPVALAAKAGAAKGIIVAAAQASEAAVVGIPVLAVDSVKQLVMHILAASISALRWSVTLADRAPASTFPPVDMRDIRGLQRARRALEIAITGGHHLLLTGPPGAGKTMLARRAMGLLPALSEPEAIEVATVRSVAGVPSQADRPFRAPHYTVSAAGLLGHRGRPGEVALAHHGILFLDELPEFSRACLEGLREPLETGRVQTMVVGQRVASVPAKFILIGAMNTCPCGWYGSAEAGDHRPCTCSDGMRARYQDRIACLRPFFDLQVDVRMTSTESTAPSPSSESIRERVAAARPRLALLGGRHRVAATIAALEGSVAVSEMHKAEAAIFKTTPETALDASSRGA